MQYLGSKELYFSLEWWFFHMLPVTWGFTLINLNSWVFQTTPPPIYSGWPRDYCILWRSTAKTYLFLKLTQKLHQHYTDQKKKKKKRATLLFPYNTNDLNQLNNELMEMFNLFFIWWTQWNNFKEHFSKFDFTHTLPCVWRIFLLNSYISGSKVFKDTAGSLKVKCQFLVRAKCSSN